MKNDQQQAPMPKGEGSMRVRLRIYGNILPPDAPAGLHRTPDEIMWMYNTPWNGEYVLLTSPNDATSEG